MSGSPIKTRKGWMIVVLSLIIVAVLLFMLKKPKEISGVSAPPPQSDIVKTPTAVAVVDDEKDDGEVEDDDDADSDVDVRAVKCGPKDKSENVRVTQERFLSLLRENYVWQPEVGAQACFQKGQSVIALVYKSEKNRAYEVNSRGKVIVESIEEMTLLEAKAEKKFLLTDSEERALKRRIRKRARRTGEKANLIKIKFLRLKSDSWFETKQTYGAPLIHPFAKTLTKEEFKSLKSEGTTFYDVRPVEFYAAKSIEGAANAPSNKFDADQFIVHSPSELEALSFSVDQTSLPQKKKTPFIIFSSCGGDALSYNAITYLRSLGYKRIRWYRGGLENWLTNGGCGTPDKVEGLGVLGADDVKKMLDAKAIPLFVSGGVDVRKFEIRGSKKVVYRQKYLGDFMAAFRKPAFTMEEFQKSGDEVDLETMNLPKDATIIVYGRYDYDWRSLKTVQLLRLKGYRFVYWYRDGLDDWLNHALFRPKEFLTTPEFTRE